MPTLRVPSVDELKLRASQVTPETLITVGIVAAAMLFVFLQLQPNLLFANTTPAGGDMGAHVWGPDYMRDHLLPNLRITGWAPDWYSGFPAYHFYFPLPSLMIALLSFVLPYGVAFKLITVLGLITLPLCAYAFGRLAGMRFPGPVLLALATMPFLFDRGFTIYGGNIPSTLAGEFSFSISLSFALLFLGVVARGPRHRPQPGPGRRAARPHRPQPPPAHRVRRGRGPSPLPAAPGPGPAQVPLRADRAWGR